MAQVTVTRPEIILKDYQNTVLSSHHQEFQAIVAAELQQNGTYTIERPTTTIIIEAE